MVHFMSTAFEKIYHVSDLTYLVKEILESSLPVVTVEGELSNFRPSSTGHWYFSLKDESAMISCVMFKGNRASTRFIPADGQKVIVKGKLSVYAKRGTYQIICSSMEKSGEGTILAMLERRKRKLAESGYFDEERKKPLPSFPSRIVVVTSPTGAALRDILHVLERRNSGVDVVILPAPVQGDAAGTEIAAQIRRANMLHLGDVIITGRGGGSLEDLLPFSDEEVVRAIYESEIPVISAVGHEIDTSLSDLASDRRAPTPSAAAEIVSESRLQLIEQVERYWRELSEGLSAKIERIHVLLERFTPENLENSFFQILQPVLMRLDDNKENLIASLNNFILEQKHRVELLKTEMATYSPMELMKKGYSIVTCKNTGATVTSSHQVERNGTVTIRFYSGSAEAAIEEIIHENL